jgi:hypothetical protein
MYPLIDSLQPITHWIYNHTTNLQTSIMTNNDPKFVMNTCLICDNVYNPREEHLRTKTGYIQQWQTPVKGNRITE